MYKSDDATYQDMDWVQVYIKLFFQVIFTIYEQSKAKMSAWTCVLFNEFYAVDILFHVIIQFL